jgi:hypothetical protein
MRCTCERPTRDVRSAKMPSRKQSPTRSARRFVAAQINLGRQEPVIWIFPALLCFVLATAVLLASAPALASFSFNAVWDFSPKKNNGIECGPPCTITVESHSVDLNQCPDLYYVVGPSPCAPSKEEWDFQFDGPFTPMALGRSFSYVAATVGSYPLGLRLTGADGSIEAQQFGGVTVTSPAPASQISVFLVQRPRNRITTGIRFPQTDTGSLEGWLRLEKRISGRWQAFRRARPLKAVVAPLFETRSWRRRLGLRRGLRRLRRLERLGVRLRAVARYRIRSGAPSYQGATPRFNGKVVYRKTLVRHFRV